MATPQERNWRGHQNSNSIMSPKTIPWRTTNKYRRPLRCVRMGGIVFFCTTFFSLFAFILLNGNTAQLKPFPNSLEKVFILLSTITLLFGGAVFVAMVTTMTLENDRCCYCCCRAKARGTRIFIVALWQLWLWPEVKKK